MAAEGTLTSKRSLDEDEFETTDSEKESEIFSRSNNPTSVTDMSSRSVAEDQSTDITFVTEPHETNWPTVDYEWYERQNNPTTDDVVKTLAYLQEEVREVKCSEDNYDQFYYFVLDSNDEDYEGCAQVYFSHEFLRNKTMLSFPEKPPDRKEDQNQLRTQMKEDGVEFEDYYNNISFEQTPNCGPENDPTVKKWVIKFTDNQEKRFIRIQVIARNTLDMQDVKRQFCHLILNNPMLKHHKAKISEIRKWTGIPQLTAMLTETNIIDKSVMKDYIWLTLHSYAVSCLDTTRALLIGCMKSLLYNLEDIELSLQHTLFYPREYIIYNNQLMSFMEELKNFFYTRRYHTLQILTDFSTNFQKLTIPTSFKTFKKHVREYIMQFGYTLIELGFYVKETSLLTQLTPGQINEVNKLRERFEIIAKHTNGNILEALMAPLCMDLLEICLKSGVDEDSRQDSEFKQFVDTLQADTMFDMVKEIQNWKFDKCFEMFEPWVEQMDQAVKKIEQGNTPSPTTESIASFNPNVKKKVLKLEAVVLDQRLTSSYDDYNRRKLEDRVFSAEAKYRQYANSIIYMGGQGIKIIEHLIQKGETNSSLHRKEIDMMVKENVHLRSIVEQGMQATGDTSIAKYQSGDTLLTKKYEDLQKDFHSMKNNLLSCKKELHDSYIRNCSQVDTIKKQTNKLKRFDEDQQELLSQFEELNTYCEKLNQEKNGLINRLSMTQNQLSQVQNQLDTISTATSSQPNTSLVASLAPMEPSVSATAITPVVTPTEPTVVVTPRASSPPPEEKIVQTNPKFMYGDENEKAFATAATWSQKSAMQLFNIIPKGKRDEIELIPNIRRISNGWILFGEPLSGIHSSSDKSFFKSGVNEFNFIMVPVTAYREPGLTDMDALRHLSYFDKLSNDCMDVYYIFARANQHCNNTEMRVPGFYTIRSAVSKIPIEKITSLSDNNTEFINQVYPSPNMIEKLINSMTG